MYKHDQNRRAIVKRNQSQQQIDCARNVQRLVMGCVTLSISTSLVMGCATDIAITQASPAGFDSPGSAFAAYESARWERNWKVEIESLVPEDRDERVGALVLRAGQSRKDPKIASLLEKHGFDEGEFTKLQRENLQKQPNDRTAKSAPYAASIADGVAFYVDMSEHLSAVKVDRPDLKFRREVPQRSEADDIAISDDQATGIIYTTSLEGLKEHPVAFRRIDGRWFVDLISPEEAKERNPK